MDEANPSVGRPGDWFETYTGRRFHVLDPRPDDVDILDIAHSLAMQCRYNGHCTRFYSVAEHCVHLSRYVERTAPGMASAVALLHDAPEAYTSDVIRPIKNSFREKGLTQFDDIDRAVEAAVFRHFGMPSVAALGLPSWLKALDTRILVDERAVLMNPSQNAWLTDDMEPLGVRIECWQPERAKMEFLRRAVHLGLAP